jgi:hypothetical protein
VNRFLHLFEYQDSFYDDYDRVRDDVHEEWYSGKRHQSWSLVPKKKLLRLYQENGKFGRINEDLLLDIWTILHDTVIKILINSDAKDGGEWPYGIEPDLTSVRQTQTIPNQPEFSLGDERRRIIDEPDENKVEKLKEKEWDRWFLFVSDLSNSQYIRNFGEVKGNARYSDASQALGKLLQAGYSASDPQAKMFAIDRILNFAHGLGSMAKWLVEGGTTTLDAIFEYSPQGITGGTLR